ncbi:hypothetical protein PANT_26c00032 [Moesziomyces antarcticus T-34]|uniref:Uncharacterized protein n=1 Tax=Pseudozyma antarctica (strain T-34) TaxID=1151754 RepID=M9MIX5_PSEA3|nr:hypothetical protein PANT_26c00032 [Moesziomyces antarcticus T-34]
MRAGAHASRVELSRERGRSCAARQGRTGQGKAGRKEEKAAGSRQRELHQPRPAAEPHSGTSEEVRRRGEAAERVVTHGHLFLAKRRAKPRLPVLEAAAGTPNSSTSGPVPFRFGMALGQLRLVPACSKSCCPSAAPPPLPPFLHSALGPFLGSRIRLPSALCQSQSQTVIRARLLNPNPQPQTAQTTRFGSPAPTSSSVKLSDTAQPGIHTPSRLRHVAARLAGVNSPHRIHHSLADGTMGTNTSSPASYVDQGTSMSGLARMGGAQPRNKTPKAAPSPPAQSKATPDRAQADRPSIDTLPPYQAPHTQHRP